MFCIVTALNSTTIPGLEQSGPISMQALQLASAITSLQLQIHRVLTNTANWSVIRGRGFKAVDKVRGEKEIEGKKKLHEKCQRSSPPHIPHNGKRPGFGKKDFLFQNANCELSPSMLQGLVHGYKREQYSYYSSVLTRNITLLLFSRDVA